jgi:chromosome segregation ATPase
MPSISNTTTRTQLQDLERKMDQHMTQAKNSEGRMHRIEDKLDQLAEAVISIARAEEKIAILMQDTKDIKFSLADTSHRIQQVELAARSNESDLKILNKFFWLIATTSITLAGTAILMAVEIF